MHKIYEVDFLRVSDNSCPSRLTGTRWKVATLLFYAGQNLIVRGRINL